MTLAPLAVLLRCAAALAGSLVWTAVLAQPYVVPRSESSADSQYLYDYELLRMALERTRASHGPYELRQSATPMNQARAAEEIVAGSGAVNLFARSTSIEHEQRMRPIRIQIDKGLVSYRLFLIRADLQPKLDAVRTAEELKRFSVGSFVTWADTKILRDGGFEVVTGDSYEGLFRMLIAKRFDLFSRSVDEAYREYDERRALLPEMAVDNKLLLYFPTTRYFFVQRSADGEKLAARVEAGLEKMIKDGSFDAHFKKHKGPLIERANLKSRRVFKIGNPFLSKETPLNRRELWYDPIEGR